MRIITRAVLDIESNRWETVESHPYSGAIALCKGDHSQTEQNNADSQRNMENQLMQQQLQMQQGQLGAVNKVVDPMIANGGLTPQMQAALQANLTNKLGGNYQQMMGNLNQNLVARGLTGGATGAGGGGVGAGFGALYSSLAGQQQQGTFDIANMQNSALLNELGVKMGIGSQYGGNAGMFNQGAGQALGQGVQAAYNADQAQTSWMGPVFGALGSLGGAAITGGMSKAGGCWIARAVYGDKDLRWVLFRNKFWQRSEDSYAVRILLGLYILFGEPVAFLVKRSSVLKSIFKRVFDGVLYA